MKKVVLLSFLFIALSSFIFGQCSFLSIGSITTSSCNVDGTFSIYGTVSVDNPPLTGTLLLKDCQGMEIIVATAPFDQDIFFSGDGFQANGSTCAIFFDFSDEVCSSQSVFVNYPTCNCHFVRSTISKGGCDEIANTYELVGQLEIEFPPSSGQLIIENCFGMQVISNAPFSNNVAYSFPGMLADDAPCFITVTFTSNPTCTFTHDGWNNSPACLWQCIVNAGTFDVNIVGSSNSASSGVYELCYSDIVEIASNGDFVYPNQVQDLIGSNNIPVTYDPGIWLLVYDCLPTIDFPLSFLDDPCYLGVLETSSNPWEIQNLLGDNQKRWLVPVTIYSQVDEVFAASIVVLDKEEYCYDLGEPIEATFLKEITGVVTQNCNTGRVSVMLNGGKPSLISSETFSIVPGSLEPLSATIIQGTATNGNVLIIGGLVAGQDFSFIVNDGVGCGALFTGTFEGADPLTISYPSATYCRNSGTIVPTVNGITGGLFTSTSGLDINEITGEINTNGSLPGVYVVTYSPEGSACETPVTTTITIFSIPTIGTTNQQICLGSSTILTATGAQTYSWTPSVTFIEGNGERVSVSPSTNTTFTVIGTDENGCQNSAVSIVIVFPLPVMNQPLDQTHCNLDQTQSVTFSADLPSTTFTWVNTNSNIGLASNGVGNIASFTAVNSMNTSQQAEITVIPTTNGCVGDAKLFMYKVLADPVASIGGDATVCLNSSMPQVTFTGANGEAPFTFLYTINDGPVLTANSIGNTAVVNVPTSSEGIFTYKLVGVKEGSEQGCEAVLNEIAEFTVLDLPTASIQSPGIVCQNELDVVISFVGIGGVEPYSFSYTINGGSPNIVTSTGTTADVMVPTNDFGQLLFKLVSVQESSLGSCSNLLGLEEIVTIRRAPFASIIGELRYCQGESTTLSTQEFDDYLWSNGQTTRSIEAQAINNPFSVQVTDGSGCQGKSNQVNVSEVSIMSIERTIAICRGQSVEIHGVMQDVPGTYTHTFTSMLGCDSTSIVVLIVNELPNIIATNDQEVCEGTTVVLEAVGGVFYEWSDGIVNGVGFIPGVGAHVYTVVGIDGNGCENSTQTSVLVKPKPVMDIIADKVYCAGTNSDDIVFTSEPQGTFSWTNSNPEIGLGVNGSGDILSFQTINLTTVGQFSSVSVIPSAQGCVGERYSFIIYILPFVQVDIEVDRTPICKGEQDRFIQMTIQNNTSPYTVTYDVNGVITQTQVNNGVFEWAIPSTEAGIIELEILTIQESGPLQCITPIDEVIVLEVYDLPIVDAGADIVVCPGSTVTLQATGNAQIYNWSNGVGNGAEIVVDLPIRLIVEGVSALGCVNTDELEIAIFTPVPIFAGEDRSVCLGEQVVLRAEMQDGTQTVFVWNHNVLDGIPFSPDVTTIYTVNAMDVNGCLVTDEVLITANPLPIVSAGPNQEVCIGEFVVLEGSGIIDGFYFWNNGVVNGRPFIPGVGENIYTVTGVDSNGCSNTSFVTVVVHNRPEISFEVIQQGTCSPVKVTLVNTSASVYQNCAWIIDGIGVFSGCQSQDLTISQSGSFDVAFTVEANVEGCVGWSSIQDAIRVDPTPIAHFSYYPNEITELSGIVNFRNETIGNVSSYIWEFGEGGVSTDVNPIYDYGNEAGSYTVTLTALSPLGCEDSYSQVIQVHEELVFFIPNAFTPDGNEFNQVFQPVFVAGYDPYDYELIIYNRWGEKVFESHDVSIGWDGTYGDIGGPSPIGVYTWSIIVRSKGITKAGRSSYTGHVSLIR